MRLLCCLRLLPVLALLGCAASPTTPVASQLGAAAPSRPATPPPATATALPTPAPTQAPSPTATDVPTKTPTPAPPLDLALVGARLIDGLGGPPLADAAITIENGRIVAAGPRAAVAIPPGTPTRDLAGATVLPGLVNAHVHTDALSDADLALLVRSGVTTICDLGGPRAEVFERRAQLAERGDPALPLLRVAGPIITVPGGHPIPADGLTAKVLTVENPEAARAAVLALADDGVDLIKIAVSGRTDVRWPELSDAEIRAITDAAHERGLRVAAHIDRAAALARATAQGIDTAAHMPRDRIPDSVLEQMVAARVVLIPTIRVYEALAEARGAGDAWRATTLPVMQDNLLRFLSAGGRLALGDDLGNPGVAAGLPLAELEHWRAAGVDPATALVAATAGAAFACGIGDEVGSVAPGMRADLLVVDGAPLGDLAALQRAALVIHGGQIVAP